MQYKLSISLTLLCLLIRLSFSQFSPSWLRSPYMEAKSTVIISNSQKTSGTYTFSITFSGTFTSPMIALAIPQLRIISNPNIGFNSYHSSLTSSGFIFNLLIPSSTTTVWYLVSRYIVFDTSILNTEFQAYLTNGQVGTNIAATPNGSYRTDTYSISLSPAATVVSTPYCFIFLAGATGTTIDFYQLNLTCSVQSSSTAAVTATVYPSTVINSISFYMLIWDTANLAIKSQYFVDSAVTTSYYGTQKTFLSLPYGYLDLSYFGGISSFSYNNNQDLNITLNTQNQLVYTSSTSLYDSVPQFQVRLRVCSNSYPQYNLADGLCYAICPAYTYANNSIFACVACPSGCKSCLNSTVCTSCSTGMVISNNSCTCANYSYYYSGSCYGCHYSCLTCAATGQYYNCLTCDSSNAHRTSVAVTGFNNKCICLSGYTDVGVSICSEICGDGIVINSACDDGNTQSGDGCSSQCSIETNFTCNTVGSGPSNCYYIGNVTISVYQVMKADYQNTVTIYLKVSPWISGMKQLASSTSLTSNATVTSVSYSTYQNYLVYQASYSQSLRGQFVRFDLKPSASGIFSQLPPTNVTVQLFSNDGYQLYAYTDQQYAVALSFHYISYVFGFLILASAFLYIFGRLKWVGNLLFFSLQFQYMSMIVLPSFTPILGGLSQIKTVLGYNQALGQQNFDLPKYKSFYILNFNKQYDLNVNLMVTLQGISFVMYIIYSITYSRNRKVCLKYGGDPDKTYRTSKHGKILQFFSWELFMFWTFYNMTQQITAMILFSESNDPTMFPLIIANVLCIIFAVLPLFIRRKDIKSYTQLLYYPNRGTQESIISFLSFILMYTFLAISLTITMVIYYIILILPICLIIYLFCRKPFQSRWVRAAYFINNFCILMTLIYNLLIISMEDDVFYLPFGTYIIIMFDWIFNLVVWGRQAYVICKYGGEKDLNEILMSNTKTNQSDEIDYFRDGAQVQKDALLGSVIKRDNQKFMDMKPTRRVLRRDNKDNDDEIPQGIRQHQQAALEEQEKEERQDLRKRRQKWIKQLNQTKNNIELRERSRHEIEEINARKPQSSVKIRTTNQKGLTRNQMREIDDRTIRYM